MSTTSVAVTSGQIKTWKQLLQSNSSVQKMSVDHQHSVLQKISNVFPSNIKIKEPTVIKHKERQHGSYKQPSHSFRKQSITTLTSLQSSESDQKKRSRKESISNYDAKTHQKVIDLEDQIRVMKKQHIAILESLHKEIESLKTKNKELQFQLIMDNFDTELSLDQENTDDHGDNPSITIITTKPDTEQLEELETRVKVLETELNIEKSKNLNLANLLDEERSKLRSLEEFRPTEEITDIMNSKFLTNTTLTEDPYLVLAPGTSASSTPTNSPISDTYPAYQFDSLGRTPVFSNDVPKVNQISETSTQHDQEYQENVDDYDDEMSFPDGSGSSTSTPTPPEEYVAKLQQAEVMIEKLKDENLHQRKELTNIKSTIDRNTKLKFRGCNHPNQKGQNIRMNTPQSNVPEDENNRETFRRRSKMLMNESTSLNYLNGLGNTNHGTSIARTRFSSPKIYDKTRDERLLNRYGSSGSTFVNQGENKKFPRSESLEAFPPLTRTFIKRRQSRSPMRSGLPPVPGSSGSDSSNQPSSHRPISFNLITIKADSLHREELSRGKSGNNGIYKAGRVASNSRHKLVKAKSKSFQRITAITQLEQVEEKDNLS